MTYEHQTQNGITRALETTWMGRTMYSYPCVSSTNLVAKERMREKGGNGILVVADEQTAGRGRRGRNWQSPKGEAIYMSLGLKPDFAPDKASMLTLVMAYSVTKAIHMVVGLNALIKWPNDIVVNKKKVCGILTEMSVGKDEIENVIIGIGINVNQQNFPEELRGTATSLFLEAGCFVEKEVLIAETMNCFEEAYEIFEKEESLFFIKEQYNEWLVNYHNEVVVLEPQGSYEGVAEGIDETGELLVRKKDGQLVKVYAGEVSVRGIYGYV